jgi:MFS family permease
VIITLQGIGSIAGSLIAAWTINRLGELRAAGASLVMAGLALALFPIATVPTVLPATFVIGAGVAIFLVAYTTLLQRSTPASLQGRVFAAGEAATSVPNTISIGVGAALVAAVSFRVIFAACAAGVVVVSLLLFRSTAPPAVEVTAD